MLEMKWSKESIGLGWDFCKVIRQFDLIKLSNFFKSELEKISETLADREADPKYAGQILKMI